MVCVCTCGIHACTWMVYTCGVHVWCAFVVCKHVFMVSMCVYVRYTCVVYMHTCRLYVCDCVVCMCGGIHAYIYNIHACDVEAQGRLLLLSLPSPYLLRNYFLLLLDLEFTVLARPAGQLDPRILLSQDWGNRCTLPYLSSCTDSRYFTR